MKPRTLSTFLIPLLILITGLAYSGPSFGRTMTLGECLKLGVENNPALKASRLGVASAGYDIKSARADFLPSVSSSYSVSALSSVNSKGPSETDYLDQGIRTFNIKLTQILYAGSRIVSTYEKSKAVEQVARAQMEIDKLGLVYTIETTFYKLMKAKEDVITASESVNRLTESIKSAEAFFQKELVPYVNVLQAGVDLADAKEKLGLFKNNVNSERVALFSLMDMLPDPGIEFSGALYHILETPPCFESSLQSALENRPDIKRLAFQLEVAEKDAKIAMGKYMPMVSLDIGYYDQNRDYEAMGQSLFETYDRDQRNRYWSTGVYATWDIFDGGRSWYKKEKYNTDVRKIKALIKDLQNMISNRIRKAIYSMSEASLRMTSSVDAFIAATEYYEMEEKRLKAGISTIPALLEAQYRLIRAQGNKTQAMLDYQLAKSELRFMTGNKGGKI